MGEMACVSNERIKEEVINASHEIKILNSIKDESNANYYALYAEYYFNIKDFNSVNQRYGQKCGDFVLEVLKYRFSKIEKKNLQSCYIGADQFGVYYNSRKANKKKAMKIESNILKA